MVTSDSGQQPALRPNAESLAEPLPAPHAPATAPKPP
jgi:hypothetical protein